MMIRNSDDMKMEYVRTYSMTLPLVSLQTVAYHHTEREIFSYILHAHLQTKWINETLPMRWMAPFVR